MSSVPAIQQDAPKPTACVREGRSYARFLLPVVIFLCGCLVGVGATVTFIEYRMFSIMGRPAPDPQRVVAKLKSDLDLDADQTAKVEAIVRAHDPEIRRFFREADLNRQRFEAEIAAVLNPDQKEKWRQRCEAMQKFLPPPPPPGAP
jgi:hypothetical protein